MSEMFVKLLLVDSSKPMLKHTMFLHFKEYKDGNAECGLIHPSYPITKCIAELLENAESFLCSHLSSYNLVKELKSILFVSPMLHFINCNLHASNVKEKKFSLFVLFIVYIFKNKIEIFENMI